MIKVKYLITVLLLTTSIASAESFVYITDQVDIPMRSEKSFGDNILRSLPSGSKMSILQATDDGWTQVKFEETTGWIISRYLDNNPPAREQLKKLKQTYNANKLLITKQNKRNKEFEIEVKNLKSENSKLSIHINKLGAEKEHVEQTYKDALKLEHTNEKLNSQILQFKSEIQILETSNTADQETSSRNWFIAGGFVLFLGMMIGFIFPNFVNRRRRY